MKIGIVQINGSFSKQSYTPYSAGLLEANACAFAKNAADLHFLLPLFKRQPVREMEIHLQGVNIVALSLYVWNERVSLELARRIKQTSPETIIIAGGPQVPDEAYEFLQTNSFLDLVIHGEGEKVFTKFLENPTRDAYVELPSVSFLDKSGKYIKNNNIERERDLDHFVSPYLSGVFEPLLKAYPEEDWTALWETNRGCPFSCTFCDWGSNIASKIGKYTTERLLEEVDWFSNNKIKFVYCCDANYGMLHRDLEIAKYIAAKKKETGYPQIFSVQNTKNSTEKSFQTQKVIAINGLSKGVSLSMQSLNPVVLEKIKRDNIHQETFDSLQYRFSKEKIETYSDLIIGLPGETYSSFKEGVEYLVKKGQHNRIRFNNLTILPNAEVGNLSYQKKHGIELAKSKAVHVYGEQELIDDDVEEYQYLVVGTNSANGQDWVRTRMFAWMTDLIYFDKTLQIPILIAHRHLAKNFSEIIELFMNVTNEFPIFYEIKEFFKKKATAIQSGDVEYCFSKRFLNSYWKADELMFMNVVADQNIDYFYSEAKIILQQLFNNTESNQESNLVIENAIELNKSLLKLPNESGKITVLTSYNILSWYQKALIGEQEILEYSNITYEIDKSILFWNDLQVWSRGVVWYGNRTGAYLHDKVKEKIVKKCNIN